MSAETEKYRKDVLILMESITKSLRKDIREHICMI